MPPGPRLALVQFSAGPSRLELLNTNASGGEALLLTGGGKKFRPRLDVNSRPVWLPDGSALLFAGEIGAPDREPSETALFQVAADGSSLRRVPGTKGAITPVVAADGHTFAFARELRRTRRDGRGGRDVYKSATVWLGDLAAGTVRRITPWRDRLLQSPSSFSPDGRTLAVTRLIGDKAPEAIGIELDGSADSVLVRNAIEPVYSPDGSKLAFLRGRVRRPGDEDPRVTDLYVKSTGGGQLEQLTHTSSAFELSPTWDPAGQRLAYVEWNPFRSEEALFGFGDKLMQVNSDGTCATKVLSFPNRAYYAAAWQPGPGREAGPIVC